MVVSPIFAPIVPMMPQGRPARLSMASIK